MLTTVWRNGGGSASYYSFVVGSSAVLRLNFCAKNSPLRQAAKRCAKIESKRASVRNIFIYLGAFTTMKIPMLSFEIGYLGLKFSLLRTLFALPIFIIIAILMEKFFGKDFSMNNPMSEEKK